MRPGVWLVVAFSVAAAAAPAVQAQEVVTASSRVLSQPGTVIEAESLAPQAKVSAGPVTIQNMQPFGPQWGGGAHLLWRPPPPVDTPIRNWPHLTLVLNAQAAGNYTLVLYYTVAPDYGSFRVFLNGAPVKDVSGFASAVGLRKLELAQTHLEAGPQQLVFTVFSKDPAATSYMVGLDRFELRPVATAAGTAANPQLARAVGRGAARTSDPRQRADVQRMIAMPDLPPMSDDQKMVFFSSGGNSPGKPGQAVVLKPSQPLVIGVGQLLLTSCDFLWPDMDIGLFFGKGSSAPAGWIRANFRVTKPGTPHLVNFVVYGEHKGLREFRVAWNEKDGSGETEHIIKVGPGYQNLTILFTPKSADWYEVGLEALTEDSFMFKRAEITTMK